MHTPRGNSRTVPAYIYVSEKHDLYHQQSSNAQARDTNGALRELDEDDAPDEPHYAPNALRGCAPKAPSRNQTLSLSLSLSP